MSRQATISVGLGDEFCAVGMLASLSEHVDPINW
jgi:hypothetical protein